MDLSVAEVVDFALKTQARGLKLGFSVVVFGFRDGFDGAEFFGKGGKVGVTLVD